MWYISLLYLSLHLGKYDTTESAILILLISTTGSAIFIKHPTNVTTCQGLSAMFTCGVNETTTIIWFINGIDSHSSICSQPKSETLPHGSQSTLTCPATSQLQGASVQCHYVLGVQVITSYFAYLIVQDPPSNLTIIEHNATFMKLAWVPPSVFQSSSLSTYTVVVKRGNGTLVYNETVRESQLVVPTPDPCDYYEATVILQYGAACCEITIQLIGDTYAILDITVNTSSIAGLVCKFNHASLAIGCLVTFTDKKTLTSYCKVVQRFMKVPVKVLSCLSPYDGPLSRGEYSVVAYGIENDGSLSPVPAVVQTLTVATDQCTAYLRGLSNEPDKFSLNSMNEVFEDVLVYFDELKIESKPIGEGAFGVVYLATFTRPHHGTEVVAVKTIKAVHSKNELQEIFVESTRMKSFKHPNIVEILGMCLDSPDGVPLMVLPFLVHGNLKSYLQQSRGFSPKLDEYPINLCCNILKTMCLDIAKGMKYLADQKFVHMNLAARNCLVGINLSIKISDFGLKNETNYYRMLKAKDCPVKWMSPEVLKDGISSEKSDVWAFGVTCWEVFSLGATPYPGVENHQMLERINEGLRLQKPTLCPHRIFLLVERCWFYEPQNRPVFNALVAELKYGE
ncbi:hypothetical protein EMCRGX_G023365 [Ephydatia muelleri]